jgi:hypothetical protein
MEKPQPLCASRRAVHAEMCTHYLQGIGASCGRGRSTEVPSRAKASGKEEGRKHGDLLHRALQRSRAIWR